MPSDSEEKEIEGYHFHDETWELSRVAIFLLDPFGDPWPNSLSRKLQEKVEDAVLERQLPTCSNPNGDLGPLLFPGVFVKRIDALKWAAAESICLSDYWQGWIPYSKEAAPLNPDGGVTNQTRAATVAKQKKAQERRNKIITAWNRRIHQAQQTKKSKTALAREIAAQQHVSQNTVIACLKVAQLWRK